MEILHFGIVYFFGGWVVVFQSHSAAPQGLALPLFKPFCAAVSFSDLSSIFCHQSKAFYEALETE